MRLLDLKIISIISILIVTLVAGWYPFKKRLQTQVGNDFPIGEALASGVFLGAGLLHMMSDGAMQFFQHGYNYPWPFLLVGITFLSLLWLEHLGRELYAEQGATSPAFAVLAVVMLSIHSLFAGAALGLSANISILLVILFAILAHKWAESFSLAVKLNKSALSNKSNLIYFGIFAVMAPLGVILGDFATKNLVDDWLIEPIFSSLAGGTFLYLGTLHGLKRSFLVDKCCDLRNFSFVILGFMIMALVAIWS